jgi:predicted tellurium resistance membrane protein TerC
MAIRFAIASLRSVYGVLSKAVEQLEYLEKAVGVVLGIIGVKMATEVLGIELLTPLQSLVVVLSVLGVGVGASLIKNKEALSSPKKS